MIAKPPKTLPPYLFCGTYAKEDDDTVPIRTTPLPPPLPKCDKCGKILLHCSCSERELKK